MKHPPNHILLSAVIVILHTVGVIGILIPATHGLTLSLTPINLLISLLIILSQIRQTRASILTTFLLCYALGFLVEMIGVQTGFPFGTYTYGSTLGPKIWGTPIIIGVNWFLLSYLYFVLFRKIIHKPLRIVSAATAMTIMDFLIEPVAIELGYWQWASEIIPWQNYVSWWIIAFAMQLILHQNLKAQNDTVAKTLLASQLIFFLLIFFL